MAMRGPNDPPAQEGAGTFGNLWQWFMGIFGRADNYQQILVSDATLNPAQKREAASQIYLARSAATNPNAKNRVRDTDNKLKVYNRQHHDLVQRALANAFHPINFSRMKLVKHMGSNIMRRVIHDTCMLYESPPHRRLEVKTALVQTDGGATQTAAPNKALPSGSPPTAQPQMEPGTSNGTVAGSQADALALAPGVIAAQSLGYKVKVTDVNEEGDVDDVTESIGDPELDALAEQLDIAGSVAEEQTPLDMLLDAYDWDVLLDEVERLCMVCSCVWVRPYVVYDQWQVDDKGNATPVFESGRLTYIIYTPDKADVLRDPSDPSQALAWWYYGEEIIATANGAQLRPVIHYWNRVMYFKFDMAWNILRQQPHDLGRLPVVKFHINMPTVGSYYVEGIGDDLYEATIELSILKTMQNARAKDSGFKQIAIGAEEKDVPAAQIMGGPTPIYVGEGNNVQVLDLQPQLKQYTEMWREREVSLASDYGISSADYKSEGKPLSGFAKKLDRDKILRESHRRRKFFGKGEQDLYSLTALALRDNPVPGIPALDPRAELCIEFADPTFEEDPEVQARIDALEIKFNATNIIEILARKNPELSELELLKKAYKNREINNAFMTPDQLKLVDLLTSQDTAKPNSSGEEPSVSPTSSKSSSSSGTADDSGA